MLNPYYAETTCLMVEAIIIILVILFGVLLFFFFRKAPAFPQPDEAAQQEILEAHVGFYRKLNLEEKAEFRSRIRTFLSKVRITGIRTRVVDLDRVLIASAAVIPIFYFKGWEYRNINEVLLYPNAYSTEFALEGGGRYFLGQVGTGAFHRMMILSKPALRAGFLQDMSPSNTAIHEFVHLVDKADGAIDGFPSLIRRHAYSIPWLQLMRTEMQNIHSGESDLNPYALTNEAEFFAVAAEYFFNQPEMMEERNPELFGMLKEIFEPEDG